MNLDKEVWIKLESSLPSGEKITARLAFPDKSRKLYAGIDSLKKRHLLVPLEKDEKEYKDSESRGLSITTRDLIIKGTEQKKYIDILCQDISGHIIFNAIAEDISEKLDRGIPNEVILGVVDKWRNFWGKEARELLSYNQIIGLFAELWFLYHWLFPKIDKIEAVNYWRGPLSSRHDFEWSGKSVEVKATTCVESRTHKIHGIEQLSPPQNGDLLLFSLRLREEQGAENTLPNLIVLCREKLKDNIEALSKFENLIAITGYSPVHDEAYSQLKFRIIDEKLFKVTDDFPKIISESFIGGFPSGVGLVEYTINLDGYDNLCIARNPNEFTLVIN